MKLEKWALMAEIVGGIAIVLSLVFVGYEIRQTREVQVQTFTQASVSDYIDAIIALNDSPEMACIWSAAVVDYQSISGSQRAMLHSRLLAVFSAFQEILVLYEQGAIDEDIWEGFSSIIRTSIEFPGLREYWSVRRDLYGESFRAYVDGLIAVTPAVHPALYVDDACRD